MHGIRQYTTSDGLRVAFLHYSADEGKDPETAAGLKWYKKQIKGFPGGPEGSQWQQEYEINFRVRAGDRVFADWDGKIEPRVTFNRGDIEIGEHWPVYGGFDYGVANKTVFTAHALDGRRRAYCFDEVIWKGDEVNIDAIATTIQRKPYFDQIRAVIGDPSIWAKDQLNQMSRTSVGDMLSEAGLHVSKGRNERGVDMTFVSLLKGFLWQDLEDPKWMISKDCVRTIASFRNLRKKPNLGMKDYKDAPEEIIQKNVDEFDSCKYFLLSINFEGDEIAEVIPGSFDWEVNALKQEKKRMHNVVY